MNPREERFPLFDSLRGLAAASVLVCHISFVPGILQTESWLMDWVRRFDIAPTVFFLISGFLLYRPFARAHLSGEAQPGSGPYAWRRFLRIVPAYWVALTVVTIWIGLAGVFTAGGIVTYYGFGQVYRAETFGGGLLQAWTISVEVAFYAMLPLYALLVRRLARRRGRTPLRAEVLGLGGLIVGGIAWNAFALTQTDPYTYGATPWLFTPPAFLHHFAAGMALAVASVALTARERPSATLRVLERRAGLWWLIAGGLFVFMTYGMGLQDHDAPTDLQWFARMMVAPVLSVFFLLPAVFGYERGGAVRRLLANRALLYLGVVSYGFYLYHVAVIKQIERWGFLDMAPGEITLLVWSVVVIAGSVVLASVSWRLLEQPFLRLKSRVRDRRRAAPQATEAAPSAVSN